MKLYTESQIRKAIELAQEGYGWDGEFYLDYVNPESILEKLTPIELPSDEEIELRTSYFKFEKNKQIFYNGAKWVIELIKQ